MPALPASRIARLMALLVSATLAAPVLASDTLTELPIGGFGFRGVADLSLDSQELTVTPDRVAILYKLSNPSPNPITFTMTFALPEVDLSDPDVTYAYPTDDPLNFVAYAAKVDGKPAAMTAIQKARLNGKDVTEILRRARLPLLPLGRFPAQLALLTPEERDKLAGGGLLNQAGTDANGAPLYFPSWSVTTVATRKQTLAPAQATTIELRYRNSTGMGQDTVFRKALRQEKGLAPEIARQRETYCIDDGFLNGVDKLSGGAEANTAKLQERRIHHLLRTIDGDPLLAKDFRLVVDKGSADRLVSFCFDNLKRITPSSFEMRAQNFVADRDLKILIVGKIPVATERKPKQDAPYSATKQTAPVQLPPGPDAIKNQ